MLLKSKQTKIVKSQIKPKKKDYRLTIVFF
nr:MAG TPA: hypothetical protein [Caudoviricetes sp.]